MTAQGSPSALERKLAVSGDSGAGGGRSALRALRLALARMARKLHDLPLAVIGARQARCDHDGAARYLSDDRLLVLLDGAGGQAGAVSLDRACVTALVRQQTVGCVTDTAPEDRGFTATDAALAEPLIEALLSRAAELADRPDDRRCLSGFRFGARVGDVRALLLALEADRFRVFDLTVDIAEGVMQGAICLVLPDLPDDVAGAGAGAAGAVPAGPGMERAFGVMRAELTATICRLRLPLADLAAMRPGDVLPLLRERLEETELVTIDGRVVAAGRLGQINGLRALRLNETAVAPDPSDDPDGAGFADRVVAAEPVAEVTAPPPVSDGAAAARTAGLPAPVAAAIDPPDGAGPEEEPDNLLERMTPEEAVAEISQLAGLSEEEAMT